MKCKVGNERSMLLGKRKRKYRRVRKQRTENLIDHARRIFWTMAKDAQPDGKPMHCALNQLSLMPTEAIDSTFTHPRELLKTRGSSFDKSLMGGINAAWSIALQRARKSTPPRPMLSEVEDKAQAASAKLSTMLYSEYLKTPHWQAMRQKVLAYWDNRCAICSSDKRIDVHHRTYDRRGRELLTDLIPLCRSCHQTFHETRKLA